MKIPINFPFSVPFSNTGEHHGIIHTLNKSYNIDLLGENYIKLSSTKVYTGEINTLVKHGTGHCQAEQGTGEKSIYIQVTFLKGFVFPTGYTIKGMAGGYTYPKSWYVYGIHEGDEEKKEEEWDLLGENDTTESTYCQKLHSSYNNCDDTRVGSFTLRKMPSSRGYKHMRWQTKSGGAFITAGIDVYGTLSMNSRNMKNLISKCRCKYNRGSMISILLFMNQLFA